MWIYFHHPIFLVSFINVVGVWMKMPTSGSQSFEGNLWGVLWLEERSYWEGGGWVGLMFQRLKLFPVSLFFQLGVGDFPPRWTLDPLKPYAQTHWSSISCFGHGCFSTMKKAINYMTTAEYVNNYANKFSNIMEIFLYFNNGGVCMDLDVCQRSMHV